MVDQQNIKHKESQHNISGLPSFFGNIVSGELPTDRHTTGVFTTRPTATSHLSTNHHHTARSAATSPASACSAVNRCQTAAAVEPLHLTSIGPFQDHCCQTFKSPFQHHPKSSKNNSPAACSKKFPKQEALHCPTQNILPPHKKISE